MNKNLGWISLYRSTKDHWLWPKKRPFTKLEAWIDLLIEANHSPNKFDINGTLVSLERGQQARSQLTLAKEWNWSINKVKRFLKQLESDSMLNIQTNQLTTIISICNYSSFQDGDIQNELTLESTDEKQTRNGRITNNNDNNENKKKTPAVPYEQIANLYNEHFASVTGNPKVKFPHKMSPDRKRNIKKLWDFDKDSPNDKSRTNNLDHWERYFKRIAERPHFQANAPRGENHANWKPDIEYVTREKVYIKVREGSY